MKPAAREWVRCAEEDFDVATALLRRRSKTASNSVGFHCQQCVEKYFKAFVLSQRGWPKTRPL
jgi:HEPN domain-containing protein